MLAKIGRSDNSQSRQRTRSAVMPCRALHPRIVYGGSRSADTQGPDSAFSASASAVCATGNSALHRRGRARSQGMAQLLPVVGIPNWGVVRDRGDDRVSVLVVY